MAEWDVLIRDHHEGYIEWERFEENQRMLLENAHVKRRAARKSGRGGRALLTGLVRCGRCGRMMRVFDGMRSGHAHRYQCRGDDAHVGSGLCIGIGGIRVDRAIVERILEAVAEPAVDAALVAVDQTVKAADDVRRAVGRELEEARYEASLAERRYDHVDQPSGMSRASWRPDGTPRSSVSPLSKDALPGWTPSSRRCGGSIARPCCAWPATCRGFGTPSRPTHAPNSGSCAC